MNIKKMILIIMIIFYILAGVNHFLHPSFYLAIIPPYILDHVIINYLAGAAEIILALFMMMTSTRKLAAIGIIIMLIAYLPTHIYMIEVDPKNWLLWVRLFIGQPILILWAWWHKNTGKIKEAP